MSRTFLNVFNSNPDSALSTTSYLGDMADRSSLASEVDVLAAPLTLPCGVVLQNRLVKAAMSDSLGDGAGRPTSQQIELYRRWSSGGVGLSLIGEVQVESSLSGETGESRARTSG